MTVPGMPGLPAAIPAVAVMACGPPWVILMWRSRTPIDVFGTKNVMVVCGYARFTEIELAVDVPVAPNSVVVRLNGAPWVTCSHWAAVSVPAWAAEAAIRPAAATRHKNRRLRILELSFGRLGARADLATRGSQPAR